MQNFKDLPGCPEIHRKHWSLLSRPFKHKITNKFVPTIVELLHYPKEHKLVYPEKNRRLKMLALLPEFKTVEKYDPSTEMQSMGAVSKTAINAKCTPRIDHLSRPFVRKLRDHMKEKKWLGKHFVKYMNERINMSLDTIYYHQTKSLMDIKKMKSSSSPEIKRKIWDNDGDPERTMVLAMPKRLFRPRRLAARKWAAIQMLLPRCVQLCVPKWLYKSPSQDSFLRRRFAVPLAARQYVATDRIRELALLPKWKYKKPYVYTGKVTQSALEYEISDRVKALSEPRARANAPESDYNENAYVISPNALKYKATPRIMELAQPRKL